MPLKRMKVSVIHFETTVVLKWYFHKGRSTTKTDFVNSISKRIKKTAVSISNDQTDRWQ